MSYKYFEIRKVNDDIVVIANTEKKPIDGAWYVRPTYASVLNEWENNHKILKPFDKEHEKKLIDLSQANYIDNIEYSYPNWQSDIEKGISVPIENILIDKKYNGTEKANETGVSFIEYAHYIEKKDTELKEESQEEMICDLIRTVTGGNFVSTPRRMELGKQKFKIIRI